MKKGFDIVTLTELNFQERIIIFKQAKIVVEPRQDRYCVFLKENAELICIGTENEYEFKYVCKNC